jgi:putative molybdopterin biosynthesis protein
MTDYLTNVPLELAYARMSARLAGSAVTDDIELIPVHQALGRRLTDAQFAVRSVPHYLACAMDGLAVQAERTFGASETTPVVLDTACFKRVDTGDVLPDDCDAVVMIEEVIWQGDRACLCSAAVPWQHVRQIGEDFCAGDMLMPGQTVLDPAGLGILLAGGIRSVPVWRRLVVAVIPTGDELVPADQTVLPGEIPEYSATMTAELLRQAGAVPHIYPIVPDDVARLDRALTEALAQSDWVLILAGSSAGRDDYTARVIAAHGEIIAHGLAIRPGKPAVLALCDGKPVIGLPGYPVSTLIVLDKLVLPLLRQIGQLPGLPRPRLTARLSRRLVSSLKYQEFVRVRLCRIGSDWTAVPLPRGAGLLHSFTRSDGLLTIGQNQEGLEAGAVVSVELLRSQIDLAATISVTGSHDPLLDDLADLLAGEQAELARSGTSREPVYLNSAHIGSLAGLLAVRRGETHLAGIHLLDASGVYNIPWVERFFPDGQAVLLEGVCRSQGLIVAAGNPLQLHGLADLVRPGCRFVNRQSGAGTRLLLDYTLRQLGLDPAGVSGYTREEMTHTAVAAQIAAGSADAGLGILAAARLYGLDFVPVAEEQYDFLLPAALLDTPPIRHVIRLLQSAAFARRLASRGGYRLLNPGRIKPYGGSGHA